MVVFCFHCYGLQLILFYHFIFVSLNNKDHYFVKNLLLFILSKTVFNLHIAYILYSKHRADYPVAKIQGYGHNRI